MNFNEAKKRAKKLRKEIRKHRYAYHVEDKETISPEALDSLKKELFEIEQEYPKLVTPESPTQRVGGKPLDKFEKVEHRVAMLSFNDAFNEQDMKDWVERLENHLGREIRNKLENGFYCELKFDGLAVELVYQNGSFVQGSTRGDGKVGEDVTQNLKTIESIPLKLTKENLPEIIVVRGEVLITKDNLKKINEQRKDNDEKPYANPRNLAAGTIRQLDPKVVQERNLDFFAYDIALGFDTETHEEEHGILNDIGFKSDSHSKKLDNLESVFKFRDKWMKKRGSLPYEIDGVVVQINNNEVYEDAGVVGKAPRGAIAYKFPPKEATSQVKDIKVQVGRTGALTPVAVLKPVQVGGVTIAHASLHNEDQIRRLDVRIGDTVVVSRSGDVIPQITRVLKDMRDGDEKKFSMPSKCPIDGSDVVKSGAIHKCSNPRCGARNKEQLYHFVSRPAFDIDGVGPKIIDRFLDEGLIADFSDLFELKEGDIEVLEGFGEKSAKNIIEEIKESKEIELPRFVYSLGIHHIGNETSVILSERVKRDPYFKNRLKKPGDVIASSPSKILDVMKKVDLEDWERIKDIGPEVAKSIHEWIRDDYNKNLVERMTDVGIKITMEAVEESDILQGKKFVITGSLSSMTRKEAKEKVRLSGGKATSSVSSNTDYLVTGDDSGQNKVNDAQKYDVEIIGEEEFKKLFEK